MKYRFTVIKSKESNEDDFESALYCSVQSVNNILNDYDVVVSVQIPNIYVSLLDESTEAKFPFSLDECGSFIKGAFTDASGRLYPQFALIEKEELFSK